MMCLSWSQWYWPICCLSENKCSHFVDSKQTNFPYCIVGQLMSITNGIKLIHLVGSIDQDSNKYREHNFSGLDQMIHLVVSADLESDPLKYNCEHGAWLSECNLITSDEYQQVVRICLQPIHPHSKNLNCYTSSVCSDVHVFFVYSNVHCFHLFL